MGLEHSSLSKVVLGLQSMTTVCLVTTFALSSKFYSFPKNAPVTQTITNVDYVGPLTPTRRATIISGLSSMWTGSTDVHRSRPVSLRCFLGGSSW